MRKLQKIWKITAASVTAAIMAAALTACGAGSGTQSGSESSSSGGTSGDDVVVNFWAWNPDDTTVKPYIEAFEASHPGITVEHRFIQYSDYINTTQMALQSGSGPDVFGLQVGALTNQFAPLAEDLTPYIAEELGADWDKKLTAVNQLQADGKQVGLPWMITGGGLVWANQTLVDSLGLKVPETLEELKAFCADVTAAGKTCFTQGAKDAWQNIDVYQSIINQIAPGEFYKALAGEGDFSSEPFVQAFEIWQSLFTDGIFEAGALGMTAYPDANDSFNIGDAALIAFGTWENAKTTKMRMEQYVEIQGDAFDPETIFMPYNFPQVVEGGTTGLLFGGPDVGFAVSSSSAVKDAAIEFVTWMTASEEGQKMIAETVQQPALASVPLDLADVITDEQKKALESQGPALADMVGQREIDNADVRTALGDALSAVASSQQSPADAAAAVAAAITAAG